VLALVIVALLLILFTQGVAEHLTGASATPPAKGESALRRGETILTARGERLVPHGRPPGRRIALTFDDGPDPKWTPRIASVLEAMGVPATFFVVGDHVVRYPGIVDSLSDDGFELGNHTFTHGNLTDAADWQRDLQISLTESAVAGAAATTSAHTPRSPTRAT